MTNWPHLLKALDTDIGFPNKQSSRIRAVRQGFDEQKQEHVFLIEYRVKVQRGAAPAPKRNPHQKERQAEQFSAIKELVATYEDQPSSQDA